MPVMTVVLAVLGVWLMVGTVSWSILVARGYRFRPSSLRNARARPLVNAFDRRTRTHVPRAVRTWRRQLTRRN